MIALSDAAWTSLAAMVTSIATLIGILITHRRVGAVEQKIDNQSKQ